MTSEGVKRVRRRFVRVVPCEVFSRCVGYYRPIADWHAGKLEEFKNRAMLSLKKAMEVVNETDSIDS